MNDSRREDAQDARSDRMDARSDRIEGFIERVRLEALTHHKDLLARIDRMAEAEASRRDAVASQLAELNKNDTEHTTQLRYIRWGLLALGGWIVALTMYQFTGDFRIP